MDNCKTSIVLELISLEILKTKIKKVIIGSKNRIPYKKRKREANQNHLIKRMMGKTN
jgi:RNase H-fold protein (predicted Holliday junction resolvase)